MYLESTTVKGRNGSVDIERIEDGSVALIITNEDLGVDLVVGEDAAPRQILLAAQAISAAVNGLDDGYVGVSRLVILISEMRAPLIG